MRTEHSKKSKWFLSKHELLSVYHFALQYNDWKQEYYKLMHKGAGSPEITGEIHGSKISKPTERDGIRAAEISEKIQLIESSAKEAGGEFYKWLIAGVTREGASYAWLERRMKIPCGQRAYYTMRRHFYWILNKKL